MMEVIQDAIVTLVAAGALAVVLRRVLSVVRPAKGPSVGCSNCPSKPACVDGASSEGAATTVPLRALQKKRASQSEARVSV